MSASSEKSIFLQALDEASPAAREAFLAEACFGDAALRVSVEELLDAHERADNPLDQPAAELKPGSGNPFKSTILRDDRTITERPGTMIGPYKLMEQIGEGGFGLVFVAEQHQPMRRKVALKVIKPGMDSRDVVARFEAERQALALMDHSNIARVLDGGTTDAGRPYFVMELVRGVPITQFCAEQQLSMRARLELFVTVCSAVQHAHQKGVIHRDIKPSNVLVTLHDETPVVKVIDFGVAKAIGQSLTDKTIYTRFAAMIGTPLYMSPEQAEMSGLDVDTRSDIYSLGVLLYELLTGTTPFDRERFNTVGHDEVRRIIREEDPPKPSTRLTTLVGVPSTSSTRPRRSVEQLSPLFRSGNRKHATVETTVLHAVPADLDWIVMKAMEKDRRRRYESAGSLAADLGRFLGEQPVEARPPSRSYKLRKFARRNKVTLVTASLVAAAMMAGTAISVWQATRAVSERNEKQAALQLAVNARNDADEARKQVEEFAERLKEANILVTSGRAHADAERRAPAYTDYTQAIERQPNYYNAWVERASLEVRLGLWKLAAEDYSKALELGVPADNPANWGIPQLFLFNGDEASYREYCLGLLKQSEQGSQGVSVAVIRSCVIAAEPVTEPVALANRIEELLAASPPFPAGPNPPDRPPVGDRNAQRLAPPRDGSVEFPPRREFERQSDPRRPERERPNDARRPPGPPDPRDRFPHEPPNQAHYPHEAMSYVAGLAHYRAGQFDEAVARLRQAIDDRRWRARPIAYPALAMAYHRSGEADKAKEALASAEMAIDQWTQEMLNAPEGKMPLLWFDWIESQLLFREAAILLTGFAPADDPRLRKIEQRALDSIQSGETGRTP